MCFNFENRSTFFLSGMSVATAASAAAAAAADAVVSQFKCVCVCVYNMVLKRVWRISGKSESNNAQLKAIIWMSVKCYYGFYWFVVVVRVLAVAIVRLQICMHARVCVSNYY